MFSEELKFSRLLLLFIIPFYGCLYSSVLRMPLLSLRDRLLTSAGQAAHSGALFRRGSSRRLGDSCWRFSARRMGVVFFRRKGDDEDEKAMTKRRYG